MAALLVHSLHVQTGALTALAQPSPNDSPDLTPGVSISDIHGYGMSQEGGSRQGGQSRAKATRRPFRFHFASLFVLFRFVLYTPVRHVGHVGLDPDSL